MTEEIAPFSEDQPESGADSVSFWQWLRQLVWGPPEDNATRLRALSEAIERHPQHPVNYVLRGEIYLKSGAYEQAARDFELAYQRAAQQFDEEDWGLLSQTLRDRAERGLELARHRLR
jgi:uncharacterized protein HemY